MDQTPKAPAGPAEQSPLLHRGANWTPPADGSQCFGALGGAEICAHCGKHIRHHFGGTEYRCDPRESDVRTKDIDPDFRREPKTGRFCCRCQKDIKPGAEARWVYLRDGGNLAVHPDDVATHARVNDLGWWLIGPECVRIVGAKYTAAASPALHIPRTFSTPKAGTFTFCGERADAVACIESADDRTEAARCPVCLAASATAGKQAPAAPGAGTA